MSQNSDILVIASARAKAGKERQLEMALRDVAKPTRAQPGSIAFSLYRSNENPAVIVGFERWASKEDHARHLRGAHVQKLMAAMADILAEPPNITTYEVLDE